MKKYRNYTDKDIIEKAASVTSLGQLLLALNLKQAGGNYFNMQKNLLRLNINTDHWIQKGSNAGKQFKHFSTYKTSKAVKSYLIKIRGHICESCQNSTWLSQPITLELEHIDGDRTNNCENNLKLLCPNCHSYTKTWRRRKSSLT